MSERRLLVATTNRHKVIEIRTTLAPLGWQVEHAQGLPAIAETGRTFAENARLKARAAAALLGEPALAEDSGLVVACLGNEPGVRSARYAGEKATDAQNNARLIERLSALGAVDPAAAFVCHVAIALPDGSLLAEADGRVAGVIRWPARGAGGFGYDPLFHHPPSGLRLAELSPERKSAISHRGMALRRLCDLLRSPAP